jgi:2-phosphosulfolactate phosphatase
MSFEFIDIPFRPSKPRKLGISMILDKSMSQEELSQMLSIGGRYIDIIKFGWGTSRLIEKEVINKKIEITRKNNVISCTGGTLFEIAYAQNCVDDFFSSAKDYGFDSVEISDGVVDIPFNDKIRMIKKAKKLGFIVFSEVGKKDSIEDQHLLLEDRIDQIRAELDAGAFKVVLEARENGSQGIYDDSGEVIPGLLDALINEFGLESLIFEAPLVSQQTWLISNLGNTVNLGNINPLDALSTETLRTGLRAGTTRQYHLEHVFVFIENGISGGFHASSRNDVIIVVDALRASSTIVTALASGMSSVKPVSSADECIGEITAGERGGTKISGLMYDNSPKQFLNKEFIGKKLVLTSTNGTECIKVSNCDNRQVLIGCLLNAKSVAEKARYLAKKEKKNISIVMAGRNNKIAEEDLLAASEIMSNLHDCSLKGYIKTVYSDNLERDFLNSGSGKNLVSLGKREDVIFCAQTDIFQVVPMLKNGFILL